MGMWMTENKSYELTINERGQLDIIDHIEGKKRNAICIYNDLGVPPFSSAKAICNKLNEQEETIQELYDFRLIYNALLFNEWSKHNTIEVYKSKKHSDGELCFDGEWFVVVAILPTGQITNHYHIKYWDYFQIKEYPQVKDEFDGHTPIDVLNRLKSMVMWND